MKTLDEHNEEARQRHSLINSYPQRNGIACPKCGAELYDSDAMVLTSSPPQRNVHCSCGYKGYRVGA